MLCDLRRSRSSHTVEEMKNNKEQEFLQFGFTTNYTTKPTLEVSNTVHRVQGCSNEIDQAIHAPEPVVRGASIVSSCVRNASVVVREPRDRGR